MIVVFGGVQPDTPTGRRRMPPETLADVEDRVRRLLGRVKPRLVVGAAAGGADLVVTRAARLEGLRLHLSLPHDRRTFRAESVSPHGPEWEQRYDRLLADGQVVVEEHADEPGSADVYRRHNQRMVERARSLADPGEEVWALVVRPPAEVVASVSDDLAARAEELGLLVLDLDPLARPAERARAFVAMPYGRKYDPVIRKTVDCDVVFDRVYVPVLEDLDLEWQRADLEADSGIIHVDMIESLARADVVIADLATLNCNVAYELGLRHALADRATVLTHPRVVGVRRPQVPPFDVQPIRCVGFERSLDRLTDTQATDAVRELRRMLTGVLQRRSTDSPVSSWFARDGAGRLVRRASGDPADAARSDARKEVQAALRSSSVHRLREAARTLADAPVDAAFRRGLHLQLGSALLEEGAYADARAALRDAEPPTGHPLRVRWLQQQALLESWYLAPEDDPVPRWDRAERLLAEVLAESGDSEETCGIAAGIVKRRLRRALVEGRRPEAAAHLRRMTDLYRRGFRADPGYYAGVNLTAAIRLGSQRFGSGVDLAEAAEALVVSRFFARRDEEDRPDGFWPAVTLAELALHQALLEGRDAGAAEAGYLRAAALPAPAEWRRTAAGQLRFFRECGDDPDLTGRLAAVLDP